MVEVEFQLTCNSSITEIEVTYTSSTDLREAEADENNETIRKNFTVEEIAEIDEFFQRKRRD